MRECRIATERLDHFERAVASPDQFGVGSERGSERQTATTRIGERAPALALLAVFVALVAPLIVLQRAGTAGAGDQEFFHLPAITQYAHELPRVELFRARAIEGPLYHLTLAPVVRYVSSSRAVLQSLSSVFALAFLLVVFATYGRLVGRWAALALTLPLACSLYVVQSAGWLATDDASLLFVAIAVFACLDLSPWERASPVGSSAGAEPAVATGTTWRVGLRGRDRPRLALAGVASLLAVWTRQIDAWLVGIVLVAGVAAARPLGRLDRGQLLRAVGAAAIPLLGVAVLLAVWGGLTPPRFQGFQGQPYLRPSSFALALAVFGLFSIPFLAALGEWPRASLALLARDRAAIACVAAGAATALVVPSSYSPSFGRAGGVVWHLVAHGPVVGQRSLLLAVLAAWGALTVLQWWRLYRGGADAWRAGILLLVVLAVAVAQAVSANVFQRYFEPVQLIVLISLTALAWAHKSRAGDRPRARRAAAWLGVLIAVQLAVTGAGLYAKVLHGPSITSCASSPWPRCYGQPSHGEGRFPFNRWPLPPDVNAPGSQ